ncbi:class I SAM-dependent methyltransferase [Solihabitans fulvus]|uniref:Class I SAM-dependent methyltransferase n=1 Tax=Solihabitans fulvus TaxID=1892852 RepID=A0A5B2XEN6_9PSEU|nr:methyltransferase domain-containing protein [Solihabitans fulvus]KAA2261813.1 class I SAM-dependent methyltransferase [Solihabitans fulvus]
MGADRPRRRTPSGGRSLSQSELTPEAADELHGQLVGALGVTGQVIDVGAGSGSLGAELARRGVPLTLSDLADWRVGDARELPFLRGDSCAMPVRTGACAGVHMARVLYHVPAWRDALAELARILAPEAALCLSLGARLYTGAIRDLLDELFVRAEERGVSPVPVVADISGPDEVDAVLAGRGLSAPEVFEVSCAVPVTPREAIAEAVRNPVRWAAGQELSVLPELGAAVLAASGLAEDEPLAQDRRVAYRIYRRIG